MSCSDCGIVNPHIWLVSSKKYGSGGYRHEWFGRCHNGKGNVLVLYYDVSSNIDY